jgi:putative transposase
MDGKGRWMDNVFIERLWRSVKYEGVYLWAAQTMHELERLLESIRPSKAIYRGLFR